MKKLFSKAKKINHLHIMAVAFLLFVFYIGTVILLPTYRELLHLFLVIEGGLSIKVQTIAPILKDQYTDILEFSGPVTRNKGSYINLNGLMARAMGQRYMNERVKLDNGHLSYFGGDPDLSIELAVTRVTRFAQEQKARGKHFLFVMGPGQFPLHEDIMPTGFDFYFVQQSNDFMSALRENNVPVLDLREELIKDGISQSEAVFVTDHHWRPETGFWAYAKIVDYLMQEGVIDPIDPGYTDIGQFNVDVHENWFLGTAGKRTGIYFAGVDDFSIISPNFDTHLSVEIPSEAFSMQGDFLTATFDHSLNYLDYFNANPYHAYGHSGHGLTQYRNEHSPSDLRVLCIGDSYAIVPFTFLSLVARDNDHFDLRLYHGEFFEHYLEFDPDVVIILIGPDGPVSENTTLDFFNDRHE